MTGVSAGSTLIAITVASPCHIYFKLIPQRNQREYASEIAVARAVVFLFWNILREIKQGGCDDATGKRFFLRNLNNIFLIVKI